MQTKTRTVTADGLKAGDDIYLDGRLIVERTEDGTEPTFLPGQRVVIVKGRNAFGHEVSKWARPTATFRVAR